MSPLRRKLYQLPTSRRESSAERSQHPISGTDPETCVPDGTRTSAETQPDATRYDATAEPGKLEHGPMATFTGFGGDTLGFLERLASNNNRDWFGEHKGEYEALVLEPALDFITAMGPVLANISDCFEAIPKRQGGSLMRVYRDALGQDALQDQHWYPVPASGGQGRPRPGLLPAHRSGPSVPGRGHVATQRSLARRSARLSTSRPRPGRRPPG